MHPPGLGGLPVRQRVEGEHFSQVHGTRHPTIGLPGKGLVEVAGLSKACQRPAGRWIVWLVELNGTADLHLVDSDASRVELADGCGGIFKFHRLMADVVANPQVLPGFWPTASLVGCLPELLKESDRLGRGLK